MPFKTCTCCGKSWETPLLFLNDAENRLDGYQFDSRRIVRGLEPEGMLIFTHLTGHCETTLALPADLFAGIGDLLPGGP